MMKNYLKHFRWPDLRNWLVAFLFLPFLLVRDVWRSKRTGWKKLWLTCLALILVGSIWWIMWARLVSFGERTLLSWGVVDELTEMPVRGPSMTPTILDGENITLKSPKRHGLERGDIVSFSNRETGGRFFLKRLIGMEGETVEIINGNVYVNDQVLEEDYVLDPGETFGNTFLTECEPVTVPENHWLVMGDNRIVSMDSRIIGFVHESDIGGVIKPDSRPILGGDATSVEANNIEIEPDRFLEILNRYRAEKGVKPLTVSDRLNGLAVERAGLISDDVKNWKTRIGSIEEALDDSYRYVRVHEYVTQGYLSEADVVAQIRESVFEQEAFSSDDFLEVGIGVRMAKKGECEFPVLDVVMAWPLFPTYTAEELSYWRDEVSALSGWLNQLQLDVTNPAYDSGEIRGLITDVSEELVIARRLLRRMEASEWLTEQDYRDRERYNTMIGETGDDLKRVYGF